jgi:putative hydrolase of the HAD superfamily
MLRRLKRRYTLASITNGNSNLETIGIAGHFAFSLSAEIVGARKPRPNLFRAALHRAGVEPHEAVHIGDHHEDDIHGARKLGMHTIWFNPEKRRWEEYSDYASPADTVHCLSEISEAVSRIESRLHRN